MRQVPFMPLQFDRVSTEYSGSHRLVNISDQPSCNLHLHTYLPIYLTIHIFALFVTAPRNTTELSPDTRAEKLESFERINSIV